MRRNAGRNPDLDQRRHAADASVGQGPLGRGAGQGAHRGRIDDREAGLRRRSQVSLPSRRSLPRRPVQALQVPQIFATSGWSSRRASRLPSSAATPTISISRATTSIAPSSACTRTEAGRDARPSQVERDALRRPASRCLSPATPAATDRQLTVAQLETPARSPDPDDPRSNFRASRSSDPLRRRIGRATSGSRRTCCSASRIPTRSISGGCSRSTAATFIAQKQAQEAALQARAPQLGLGAGLRQPLGDDRRRAEGSMRALYLPLPDRRARAGRGRTCSAMRGSWSAPRPSGRSRRPSGCRAIRTASFPCSKRKCST